jgi:photosystem II stability/assembly factor-like uncharacterized protein
VRAAWPVLALLAWPTAALAGWDYSYNGIGQSSGFLDVSSPDPSTCYAVGVQDTGTGNQEGVVMITHDGGGSWTPTKPSTSAMAFYVSVFSPSAQKAYVGTALGKVWITTNGGGSWEATGDVGLNAFQAVGGHGDAMVLAAVSDGRILRSDTGGSAWTDVANPLGSEGLTGFQFIDATHGWARAGQENEGVYSGGGLIRTADGGMTWETLLAGEARAISSIFFLDENEGILLANPPAVERTTDGGRTWTPLAVPAFSAGTINHLWDVVLFDRCEGWLAASTGDEQVTSGFFYTTDGGGSFVEIDMSWAAIDIPLPIPVRGNPIAFDFTSREAGFCGGFYEFLGTYSADVAPPECNEPDPTGPTGYTDEGCGCSIVW